MKTKTGKIAAFIFGLFILTLNNQNIMAHEKITQDAGRTQLGEFAPKFA